MGTKRYDAVYLVSWKDATGNDHISAHSPQETLADATSFAREAGAVPTVEVLLYTAEGVETKVYVDDAGRYVVRVYDTDVGETVGLQIYARSPKGLEAAVYQFRLCQGVETKPSSFGVLP